MNETTVYNELGEAFVRYYQGGSDGMLSLNVKFKEALIEKCKQEGIQLRQLYHNVYALENEAYQLKNDGITASWSFTGYIPYE